MPAIATAFARPGVADRHRAFLILLPSIRAYARAAARSLRCPHDREDAEADIVARAWEAFAGERPPTPASVAVVGRGFRPDRPLIGGNR